MKRYFFAMTILALAGACVVWLAIKERDAARAAKGATTAAVAEPRATVALDTTSAAPASAAPTPPPAPTPDIQAGDAEQAVALNVPIAGSSQAPPPLAPYAAWSVVRWGTSAAEVELALRQAGVVVDAVDGRADARRLRAKTGAGEVTIDFDARGATQIVVTTGNLSKEAAQAIVAKAKERAPPTKTIERSERHWLKKDTGAAASLITSGDGTTATMREEHVRERAPGGAIGFAGLRWGMSTQEVVGQLTAGGWAARMVKAPTLPFNKGDVEGTASFNQFGLRHIEISGPTTDGGAARAKELESSLGKPASVEAATKTQHLDHARMTSIDVEVTEKQPDPGITVVETYRPKN